MKKNILHNKLIISLISVKKRVYLFFSRKRFLRNLNPFVSLKYQSNEFNFRFIKSNEKINSCAKRHN
jgi:hypothetical protein